jgi:hypothetical protein
MRRFFNIGMAVLALFLTWDLYDVDNEPIDPAQIAEHRVYIRSVGELEPTLAETGEVSPRSEELQRIQPRGGDKGVRVIEQ